MKLNSGTIKEVSVRKRISVGDFQIRAEERVAINEVLDAGRLSEWKKVITHHIKRWLDGCELSQRQPFKPKVYLLHGLTQALPARIYFLTFFKFKTNR
jgi:hypothetical protein